MFTKSVVVLAAALSAASAAVLPRQGLPGANPAGTFAITAFSVAQERYGLYTYYNLAIADTADAPSNVSTTCRATTDTLPAITGFTATACDDPSVKWSFQGNGTGFILNVAHNWGIEVQHAIVTAYDNVTDTGLAYFPNEDVKQDPTVEGIDCPYLDAPSEFSLTYSRYIS